MAYKNTTHTVYKIIRFFLCCVRSNTEITNNKNSNNCFLNSFFLVVVFYFRIDLYTIIFVYSSSMEEKKTYSYIVGSILFHRARIYTRIY